LDRAEAAVTYDHWKATNPADEYLGPSPDEEDDVTIPCDFSSFDIGAELEHLQGRNPVSASSRAALAADMLADRQRELAPLMHDTLKLIWERLTVQMGTDADLIDDIERVVNATLAALEDFHDEPF
jgi:hypothetical protein